MIHHHWWHISVLMSTSTKYFQSFLSKVLCFADPIETKKCAAISVIRGDQIRFFKTICGIMVIYQFIVIISSWLFIHGRRRQLIVINFLVVYFANNFCIQTIVCRAGCAYSQSKSVVSVFILQHGHLILQNGCSHFEYVFESNTHCCFSMKYWRSW